MGQKVNPTSFRVGVIKGWSSKWFSNKGKYRKNLLEDLNSFKQYMEAKYKEKDIPF